ncbi:MAG TPA: DinB family protein [Vicinamibacterales bacterium]|jgi:hypothetical protein|nr:DinB family protein [Vicinamibacterales bacterium]
MRALALFVLAGALSSAPAAAQTYTPSSDPVSDAVRQVLTNESKNISAAAKLMPADKYAFHPTPPQMTFGQIMAHIAQTNAALCGGIGDLAAPEWMTVAESADKDTLVAAIDKSFEYCTQALAKVKDTQLADEVTIFGRRTGRSRAFAMVTIATDWTDHYSTAASYLRLNGILPPTAQPKP